VAAVTAAVVSGLVVAVAVTLWSAVRRTRQAVIRRRLRSEPLAGGGRDRHGLRPEPPPWLARWLDDAGLEVDAGWAWAAWLAGVFAGATLAALAAGAPVAVLIVAMLTVAPVAVLRARRGQGLVRAEHDLPAALEAVARSLRSGASLRQAVAEAGAATPGRLGRELVTVARQVDHGATLVAALEALAERQPGPGVRLTVAALCLGVETGGAQARAVDGVAATLRDRLAVAAEVKALASQARISALVIGLAPLAFGAFAMTTDPRTAQFLFHTPLGLALLAVGCTLDGLGWLWMQRLTRVPV
jgi:tight adherence protein B